MDNIKKSKLKTKDSKKMKHQSDTESSVGSVKNEKSFKSSPRATIMKVEQLIPGGSGPTVPQLPPEIIELSNRFRNLHTPMAIMNSPTFTVFLVGTNHADPHSQEDVGFIIRNVKPNVIVLELCAHRACGCELHKKSIFQARVQFGFSYLWKAIREIGLFPGLIFFADVYKERDIGRRIFLDYGGEMVQAITEAKALEDGCDILLGDRSIQITFQRQASVLKTSKKFRLFIQVALSFLLPFMKSWLLLNAAKVIFEDDKAYQVLVVERDLYLTYSIQTAAIKRYPSIERTAVVAVVGLGHMAGILRFWGRVNANLLPLLMSPKVDI